MIDSYENFNKKQKWDFDDMLNKALNEMGTTNIIIAGKTGVGKSTLINSVFEGNMADTGQGKPVTNNIKQITKDSIPVSIYDTKGLELDNYKEVTKELVGKVKEKRTEDHNEHIHVAWICISEDSRRIENQEIELANALANEGIPVIAVITKARSDNGFKKIVEKELYCTKNCVRVRSICEKLDDGIVLRPMGLEKLIEVTIEVLPEAHRQAFITAQKVDLDAKVKKANKIVAAWSATAAGIGFTPIPFSDAIAIVPIQTAMLTQISVVFGLKSSKKLLGMLTAASGVTGLVGTIGGRAAVSGLLKLIPGVGTVVGGMISGSVASGMTVAFGSAYIKTLKTLLEKNRSEQPTDEEIAELFKRNLKLA